jgi:hypothetical protein
MPENPDTEALGPDVRAREVARAGYEGYARWTGFKTFDGRDMPQWDDLPDSTQLAWVAAAGSIVRKMYAPRPESSGGE